MRALLLREPSCALPRDTRDRHAASLALSSLAPDEPQRLARVLDEFVRRARARANPLMVDLEDEPPDAAARAWFETRRPTLEAARALASGCWVSADDVLAVAAVARCPTDPVSLRCVAPWRERGRLDLDATSRFMAWPVTHALVLRAETTRDAATVRSALRERVARGLGDVALVVPEGPADLAPMDDLGVSARAALAALPHAASAEREVLGPLAEARGDDGLLAWLGRDPARVVVVPRLAALVAPDRFEAEVRACLRELGLTGAVRVVY